MLRAVDACVHRVAQTELTYLNVNSAVRLYSNVVDPTPATRQSDLDEVTGQGYLPYLANGQWAFLYRLQPGQWRFSTPTITWPAPSSGSYTVAGLYITSPPGLQYLNELATPIIRPAGGPVLMASVSITVSDSGLLATVRWNDLVGGGQGGGGQVMSSRTRTVVVAGGGQGGGRLVPGP